MTLAGVLDHYPVPVHGRAHPHTSADAFSGARIWRLETTAGDFCLRAWPSDMMPERLMFIHRLLQRAATLAYVPRLIATCDGATWVEHEHTYWEMTTWLPGRADFVAAPSVRRVDAACTALARLHQAWADTSSEARPCPAVQRRLGAAQYWEHLVQRGWQPAWRDDDPVTPPARRAWQLVQARRGDVPRLLGLWRAERVPVQPCLCDVWHAHVLYTGDEVTGLIDYGSVKIDHVAVDLARLLGDLAGGDHALRQAGLEAYARLRPLADLERQLVDVLDATGTIIALMNWLRWLYHEGREYHDRGAVAQRLQRLVRRMTNE